MILNYQDDDGYPVEPTHYVPIIPMVLVNGALGIGTGWSTAIPNFNPSDIIKNIRRKLVGDEWKTMKPYYRGFNGDIVSVADGERGCKAYHSRGTVEMVNAYTDGHGNEWSTIQVTELPIGVWTENFKKLLMDLEEAEQIEGVNNMSSDIDVSFTFNIMHREKPKTKGRAKRAGADVSEGSASQSRSGSSSPTSAKTKKVIKKKLYFNGTLNDEFLKDIKCISPISLTNMVLFDTEGKIKRYDNVEAILEEFYHGRLTAYSMRKKAMLKSMEHSLMKITNQAKFVVMVINEELKVSNRKKLDVVRDLRDNGFDVWAPSKSDSNTLKNRAKSTEEADDEEDGDEKGESKGKMEVDGEGGSNDLKELAKGYKYLLSMAISSLTKERVQQLLQEQEETEHKVETLRKTTVKDLWRTDLDELEQHLDDYRAEFDENVEKMRLEPEPKMKATTKSSGTGSKKRKLLGTNKGSNPFKLAAKSKAMDSDSDSESESPGLSLMQRARLRASPEKSNVNKSRKRKRPDDGEEDSDWEMSNEPPLRKRKVFGSSPDSSSESSMPLKVRSSKLNANANRNRKRMAIEESDDEESDMALFEVKKKTEKAVKKQKRKVIESEDDDMESDLDESWAAPSSSKRTLRKKNTVSYKEQSNGAEDDEESEYQMSDDLEIDEFDDENDGDSEYHP